jgi:hypothetical protein
MEIILKITYAEVKAKLTDYIAAHIQADDFGTFLEIAQNGWTGVENRSIKDNIEEWRDTFGEDLEYDLKKFCSPDKASGKIEIWDGATLLKEFSLEKEEIEKEK